jgi:hypothetical protein
VHRPRLLRRVNPLRLSRRAILSRLSRLLCRVNLLRLLRLLRLSLLLLPLRLLRPLNLRPSLTVLSDL